MKEKEERGKRNEIGRPRQGTNAATVECRETGEEAEEDDDGKRSKHGSSLTFRWMASGKASNSCFVISEPNDPVEGDTGGGTIVMDPAEDSVSRVPCIVEAVDMVVVVVFLLPLLLLLPWLLPLLSVHVVEFAVTVSVPESELVRGK